MEEKKQMSLEEKIKIMDDLIADEQEALDGYHKAIDKLKSCTNSQALDELGRIYREETNHIAVLEKIKKSMEKGVLGDFEADRLYGYPIY